MNAQLNNILAQRRLTDLQRAAKRMRIAREAGARRRISRDSNPIVHMGAPIARLSARLVHAGRRAAKHRSLATPATRSRS
jgi:hypothetical protein